MNEPSPRADPAVLAERITHERELRETAARALREALEMQAARAAEERATSVTHTVYDLQHGVLESRIRVLERLVWIAWGVIIVEILVKSGITK